MVKSEFLRKPLISSEWDKVDAGLCIDCSEPVDDGDWVCNACKLMDQIEMAEYYKDE